MSSGRDEMLDNIEVEDEKLDFMGRPTKYKPEYCQKVIELGKKGKSFEQMAAELDVGYRTLCNWRDTHDDFFHALEEAHALSMAWWESEAISYMVENKDGPRLNSSIWSRSMAARFPKKYRQEVKQEITGADGAPLLTAIQVSFVEADDSQPE
jgi:hypothetical protein